MAAIPLPDEIPDPSEGILRLSRDEFIEEVFVPHYKSGEHVAFLGPTGCGKTTIAFDLMNELAEPERPAVLLVMKPRDDVVKDYKKLTGFRKTERWPPAIRRGISKKGGGFGKKRRGWIFWPRHGLRDIRRDDKMLEKQFRLVLNECYRSGKRIVFADEVVGLAKDLNLKKELEAIWMRGRSMECGLWASAQRPFEAPVAMYGQSEHLIIFKDSDKRSRDRYEEIGGVDGAQIKEIVLSLKKHEFLYVGRNAGEDGVTPALAIVSAN
jgi:energy-coupling factor transporter ATP-binding protein EcfA2